MVIEYYKVNNYYMNKLRKAFNLLLKSPFEFIAGCIRHMPRLVSDKCYVKLQYKDALGFFPDLDNPKTFSEKIQYLKLYDRNPLYTKMVDKVTVKEYVKNIIGEEFIIPTLFVWDNPDDIDYTNLPNKFVLKCNHTGGGSVYICKDKEKFDFNTAINRIKKQLRTDTFINTREWPYKNIKRKVFCEQYMEDISGDLIDYKFFCFGGKVHYCQVIKDRYREETIDFYDSNWQHMNFVGLATQENQFSNSLNPMERPENFDKMLNIAERLASNLKFVRVDLYNIQGKIYFGELTFYPASGNGTFFPSEWDLKLGNLLTLQ